MPSPTAMRLGTRGSQLALYQARTVAALIAARGGPACEIVIIKTSGDQLQDAPLSQAGGKRLFVKEIEDALLNGDVDLAVHSSKDMPALLLEGLAIAGVLPREDPLDAVVLPKGSRLQASGSGLQAPGSDSGDVDRLVALLGQTPSIGTSSVRRIAQLTRLLPNARFGPIRGNLDTRLRKLDTGEHDALVLASAGLRRLGFAARISCALPAVACVPAPGQGIIAIEVRDGDRAVLDAVRPVTDSNAAAALAAERALVEALGGGCQTPIGALATTDGDSLRLVARVIALDGSRVVNAHAQGRPDEAGDLGRRVASQLLSDGAGEILDDVRRVQAAAHVPSHEV